MKTEGEMKQFFMVTPSVEVTKKTSFESVVSARSLAAAAAMLMASTGARSPRGTLSAGGACIVQQTLAPAQWRNQAAGWRYMLGRGRDR